MLWHRNHCKDCGGKGYTDTWSKAKSGDLTDLLDIYNKQTLQLGWTQLRNDEGAMYYRHTAGEIVKIMNCDDNIWRNRYNKGVTVKAPIPINSNPKAALVKEQSARPLHKAGCDTVAFWIPSYSAEWCFPSRHLRLYLSDYDSKVARKWRHYWTNLWTGQSGRSHLLTASEVLKEYKYTREHRDGPYAINSIKRNDRTKGIKILRNEANQFQLAVKKKAQEHKTKMEQIRANEPNHFAEFMLGPLRDLRRRLAPTDRDLTTELEVIRGKSQK